MALPIFWAGAAQSNSRAFHSKCPAVVLGAQSGSVERSIKYYEAYLSYNIRVQGYYEDATEVDFGK